MVAIAAGCRKSLVSVWWPIFLAQMGVYRNAPFHLLGTPFLAFQVAFSPEKHSLVGGP